MTHSDRTSRANGLRPAADVALEFLRSRRTSLEEDAEAVFTRAGCWAPYRRKDNELITTSLLLFALVEADLITKGDRHLRVVVEPFLSTLRRWDGYTQAKNAYFTKSVSSVHCDAAFRSITELSANVKSLLGAAHEIEQKLGRDRISAAALAAAFLVARKGVFVARLDDLRFDREPFRAELDRYVEAADRASPATQNMRRAGAQRIFIVHGHDDAARETVARFLEAKLGLKVLILHEQPSQGLTIIEKFEAYANQAGYAVILLTPDDMAGAKPKSQTVRARQNVIFELGYFAGKLGRQRVCLLRKGNVEGFSDFNGVVYIDLDTAGAWKTSLAKELEMAGFQFDVGGLLH